MVRAGRLAEVRHDAYVSTEHLLLVLLEDPSCVAGRSLFKLGTDFGSLEDRVSELLPRESPAGDRRRIMTPRAKRVIDLAYDEARRLRDHYIGTEHLLLGLIREEQGVAGQALLEHGVTLGRARAAVAEIQGKDLSALPRRRTVIERIRALLQQRSEE